MTLEPDSRLRTLLPLLLVASATYASAHERKFTMSRDWYLPYPGENEIELRTFFDTNHGEWVGEVEYEYGVSDHFAIEPGFEIKKNEEGKYEVEAAEIELRFNFGEFQQDKWLPALNVDLELPFENEESSALELKLSLTDYQATGDVWVVNANVGQELEDEHESESELTGGWSHPLEFLSGHLGPFISPRGGFEAVEEFEHGDLKLGPLFAMRLEREAHFLFAYLFGVGSDEENTDMAAFIFEWEF